jgi:hypothetical protein
MCFFIILLYQIYFKYLRSEVGLEGVARRIKHFCPVELLAIVCFIRPLLCSPLFSRFLPRRRLENAFNKTKQGSLGSGKFFSLLTPSRGAFGFLRPAVLSGRRGLRSESEMYTRGERVR